MAIGSASKLVHQLCRVALTQGAPGVADEQLLARFLARRDEAAFAALVRRHGPMVLGVCRRVLGHSDDAEDAFQVTFLVLVRKAAAIAQPELLGNWLYGVALRTAQEARAGAARRRVREKQVPTMPDLSVEPEASSQETQQLLDLELSQLPDKYRAPVVLCELQGRSRREAASLLCLPEGTVSSRLATARKILAGRLAGRGVVLSASALTTALTAQAASASVPSSLIHATVQAAVSLAAGQTLATGVVSTELTSLLEGVSRTMFLTQLKKTAAVVLLVAIVGSGVGMLGHYVLADEAALADAKEVAAAAGKAGQEATVTGHFVSFKEGVLRIKVQEEKGKEPKELNWKVADETKVVSVINGAEKEGAAREAFKLWESGAVISVKVKDGKVTFIQIGAKQASAPEMVEPKDKPKEKSGSGKFLSFKDGTLTLKGNAGILVWNKLPESAKTFQYVDDVSGYMAVGTEQTLNQLKAGAWVHVNGDKREIRIGARKGKVTGTFVSFKNGKLVLIGRAEELGPSYTKKYGTDLSFNKLPENVPVVESIDGGDYEPIGTAETALSNVKEGTVVIVHGEGDDNITLIQIGAPKRK